jgi:hypothetical protein
LSHFPLFHTTVKDLPLIRTPSGDLPVGRTTVTFTLNDFSCKINVTVVDIAPPVFVCPGNVTLEVRPCLAPMSHANRPYARPTSLCARSHRYQNFSLPKKKGDDALQSAPVPAWPALTATDNIDGVNVSVTVAPDVVGSRLGVGRHEVNFIARDQSNNTASCTAFVDVTQAASITLSPSRFFIGQGSLPLSLKCEAAGFPAPLVRVCRWVCTGTMHVSPP